MTTVNKYDIIPNKLIKFNTVLDSIEPTKLNGYMLKKHIINIITTKSTFEN